MPVGAYPTFDDGHGMRDNADWSALYLWRDGEPVADMVARCPATMEAMRALPLCGIAGRTPSILFSRLAPRALAGTVIGIHYLAFFAANKIVGVVGGWYSSMPTTSFWLLHIGAAAVGLIAFTLFRLLLAPRLLREPEPTLP